MSLSATEIRQQVAHHCGVGRNPSQIHVAERTGQSEPITHVVAHGTVDIFHGCIAVFHQIERLTHHGIHDSIGNETTNIAADQSRLFVPLTGKSDDLLGIQRISLVTADDFQESQDVSGLTPMNTENAIGVACAALQLRYGQG